ncbi:unnamed protein product [Durusdinium trenchii]|uniref:Uncharacterized protein n=2 Tax=Durusdinium trenchii TaxID=1381693 RepID=A0ABP0MMH2_9DINO
MMRDGGIRSLMRHLLQLHCDDPQLVRLAAAAVLARDKKLEGWSTKEMVMIREEVQQMEGAWRHFLSGPTGGRLEPPVAELERLAALHLAFREMEEAVLKSAPIPHFEELLLRVARIQLGGTFSCRQDVEAALLWPRAGNLSAIAEDALATCLSSKQMAVGGASRVACLVGAMLSPKELQNPGAIRSSHLEASTSGAMVC